MEGKYAAVEEELDDTYLTPAARIELGNLKRQLIRDVNEMCGHLHTRSTVDVESVSTYTHEIIDIDHHRFLDELSG